MIISNATSKSKLDRRFVPRPETNKLIFKLARRHSIALTHSHAYALSLSLFLLSPPFIFHTLPYTFGTRGTFFLEEKEMC